MSILGYEGTTIVCVKRNNQIIMGGDGQVSMGSTILKGNARKVRRLYNNKIIAGFAGGTADAFTLFERFEAKLEKYQGNLMRSAVELAKDWRTDKYLRRLEALMIVADKDGMLMLTGEGDVFEPENDFIAIGSGGPFAHAAAMALFNQTALDAKTIAIQALKVAASLCVYTNEQHIFEEINSEEPHNDHRDRQ